MQSDPVQTRPKRAPAQRRQQQATQAAKALRQRTRHPAVAAQSNRLSRDLFYLFGEFNSGDITRLRSVVGRPAMRETAPE